VTAHTLATAALDAARAAADGTVYLLHFDRPYRHAGHYTGRSACSTGSPTTKPATVPGCWLW
jgi:hypothetical protein